MQNVTLESEIKEMSLQNNVSRSFATLGYACLSPSSVQRAPMLVWLGQLGYIDAMTLEAVAKDERVSR